MEKIIMLINPNQIRAARGLLNWTVGELGKRAGVGATTISAIETGRSAGSLDVLKNIYHSFKMAGVDLTEDGGVHPNTNKILIFRGHSGFSAFFDDVYDVAQGESDPDICVTNADDKLFLQWHGNQAPEHIRRMSTLKIQPARTLVNKGDLFKAAATYSLYKWIDRPISSSSSLYLYGQKSAIIDFKEHDVEITLVNNSSATQMLRAMFEVLWQQASGHP